MRVLIAILWGSVLFVGTCTESVPKAIQDFYLHFSVNGHPNWSDLWNIDSLTKSYIIQKVGHFTGFFVLSMILTNFSRDKSGIYWSIGYGVITELIQPLFYRDGRILDIIIDAAGVMLSYYIFKKKRLRL